jgi:V/A-type H+-transporting ATPase subunit D
MADIALNKSSLHRQTAQLKTYKQYLPSLDLKRKQLMAERAKAGRALKMTQESLEQVRQFVLQSLPMLSNRNVVLTDLVTVQHVELTEENLMGIRLPVLKSVKVKIRDYPYLGKPHWVDGAADKLKQALELNIRLQVETQRLKLLDRAVQKITQRVNLFDKVLIPKAQANIKRIQIYLSDMERAAVVRAKIAKRKYFQAVDL